MHKYLIVFKLEWQRILQYRFNFFLGRLRSIIVLLMLYYLWISLSTSTGTFAGFSRKELVSYVLLTLTLRPLIFGGHSRNLSIEINTGIFSKYLTMPLNIFIYNFFRDSAERIINLLFVIIEIIIFCSITGEMILMPASGNLIFSIVAVCLAIVLYSLLIFTLSSLSFWSREAMGPRFLFDWFMDFSAGGYFPLSILSAGLYTILAYLPFYYLIYFPLVVVLNRQSVRDILLGFVVQVIWILILSGLTIIIWRRGIRKYSGEGI